MNKAIVAILVSATLAVSAVVAACGHPAAQPAAVMTPSHSPNVESKSVTAGGTKGEAGLEEMQRWLEQLVNDFMITGDTVPDYLCDVFRAREKARQALLELDAQRSETQMLISRYLMAGRAVPQYVSDTAKSIEQSRQGILRSLEETYASVFK